MTGTPHRVMDEMEFLGWLGQAEPGESIIYHRGFLALDASSYGHTLAVSERQALARLAHRAWCLGQQGLVHLVQRRNGPDDFTYLAIARPRPKRTSAALSSLLLAEAA